MPTRLIVRDFVGLLHTKFTLYGWKWPLFHLWSSISLKAVIELFVCLAEQLSKPFHRFLHNVRLDNYTWLGEMLGGASLK